MLKRNAERSCYGSHAKIALVEREFEEQKPVVGLVRIANISDCSVVILTKLKDRTFDKFLLN